MAMRAPARRYRSCPSSGLSFTRAFGWDVADGRQKGSGGCGAQSLEDDVDYSLGERGLEGAAAHESAVDDRTDEQIDGELVVEVRGQLASLNRALEHVAERLSLNRQAAAEGVP